MAKSSVESKYRAMDVTISEIIWLCWLLKELGVAQTEATSLSCDNQAVLHMRVNLVFHERTKHVEMDYYFVREKVQTGEVKPEKIDSRCQLAVAFTKPLGVERLNILLDKLAIINLYSLT